MNRVLVFLVGEGGELGEGGEFLKAILAVFVVFIFLRDWRATLIAAIALPLSVIPTFWAMTTFGFWEVAAESR